MRHYKSFVMRSRWWVEKSWKPLILGQLSYVADGGNREETWVVSGDPANIGRASAIKAMCNPVPAPFSLPLTHPSTPLRPKAFTQDCSFTSTSLFVVIIPHKAQFQGRGFPITQQVGSLSSEILLTLLVPSPNAGYSLLCPHLPRRARTVYYPNKLSLVYPVHGEDFWKGSPN